jgi:purine-binding chemotaxis protein CheW
MDAIEGLLLGGAGVCVFSLEGRRFAVPLALVSEVARMPAILPLRDGPAVVEGLANVRGRITPVLAVRLRFGLPQRSARLSDQLLIVRAGQRLVGFRVDHVVGIESLARDDVVPVPTVIPGAPHMVGVAQLGDDLVMIHDPAAFLAAEEAEALERALRAQAEG